MISCQSLAFLRSSLHWYTFAGAEGLKEQASISRCLRIRVYSINSDHFMRYSQIVQYLSRPSVVNLEGLVIFGCFWRETPNDVDGPFGRPLAAKHTAFRSGGFDLVVYEARTATDFQACRKGAWDSEGKGISMYAWIEGMRVVTVTVTMVFRMLIYMCIGLDSSIIVQRRRCVWRCIGR